MCKFITALFVAALTVFMTSSAVLAQDSSADQTIEAKGGISFPKPDGWVERKGSKGVAVRLEAAGDSKSHIEVRLAPGVDSTRASTFFTSFHASLQASGLKKVQGAETKRYGEHQGTQTEYEAKGKEGEVFRLIIWQMHRGETAWIFVGFFGLLERDTLYRDYGKVIASVSFGE